MYDLGFAFAACGCGEVPKYIERARLFNVSFEPTTGDVKLYVLDRSERFLYKISRHRISRQYAGDDPQYGGDTRVLARHFGCRLDPRQIVIDAVEGDVYYLYLEDAGVKESLRLASAICSTYAVTESQFLSALNAISGRKFDSLEEGLANKAISLVKIPLSGKNVKIYARPFHSGSGFELDEATRAFLARLHNCQVVELRKHLDYLWVARELLTDRMLVVTQNHFLLHRE